MTRTYGGQTATERVALRRRRLIEAALEIAGTDGWAKATVTAVCQRAGLTERYFYESFPERRALFAALVTRIRRQLQLAIVSAIAAAPPEDARAVAKAALESGIKAVTDDPRIARIVFKESLLDDAGGLARREALRDFGHLVAQLAEGFYGESFPNPVEVDFTATLVVGGLFETVLMWVDGELPMTRDDLIEYATNLVVRVGESYASR